MNPQTSALLTDLYQLTMMQAYLEQGMDDTAVFEFFVRDLPAERNFLVAAGLEQVLEFLENLHFTAEELQWLHGSGRFSREFVDYLSELRFIGDVHGLPEGSICFAPEPVVQITASLPQAQLVESRLINLLHFQTLVASKAVRCVLAAPGKLLVDFGMRRSHGAEAGLLAARAGYVAGLDGTATVLAGARFNIPVFGTMAHSFIQAHDDEVSAFRHFAQAHPDNVVLLIDTYDTETAAHKVLELAPELEAAGVHIKGVRIDSGDLAAHAREVRQILDSGGRTDITIFASGNLDEHALKAMCEAEVPVDGFGIGTHLDTSSDCPYFDCAYKLQEYAGVARRKRSEGKATWPGRKQVYRQLDADGRLQRDVLTVEGDEPPGEPLLQHVMRSGKRIQPPEPLARIRQRVVKGIQQLPEPLRRLDSHFQYEVQIAPKLRALSREVDARTAGLT